MKAELFEHPIIEGGYIIQTEKGTFVVTHDYVKHTVMDTDNLTPISWDLGIQVVISNAYENSEGLMTPYEIALLSLLVQEKVEDGD
jgi:hypothetical protein